MIALVDMGLSNLGSVALAFARVGARLNLCSEPDELARASAIILPGVGAFGDGMAALKEKGLAEPLREHARAGRPLLGICLGMQLLAEQGEEHGAHPGLGLVPGRVTRLPELPGCRVPNMGWCDVDIRPGRQPLSSLNAESCFYFAHSYHFACVHEEHVAASLDFGGQPVTAALQCGGITGLQFHPEKSQEAGLEVLDLWLRLVARQEGGD